MFIKTLLASVTLASLGAVPAHAVGIAGQGTWQQTLLGRDLDGNLGNGPEAWYDTTLNITWLANTQAIAGTRYDTYFRGGSDDEPYDNESNETDGRAVLSDAFFWVQQLNVGVVALQAGACRPQRRSTAATSDTARRRKPRAKPIPLGGAYSMWAGT